ncbi:NRDE family protein [Hahella sp. SMD15-11]|uniref:NRDE family protein n=1 Tax=Thermohahella caldifontis TaxID=3142973 RepID=A0AB39UWA7_9GAMM
MCLAFFAIGQSTHYPFIALANRDEFYARPTRPLHRWATRPVIRAGRDEQAGGTWLGCTADRFALVTNVRRHPQPEGTRSRGELVVDALLTPDLGTWFAWLESQKNAWTGFNLIVWDKERLHYLSNRTPAFHQLRKAGIYGLSNAELDSPWFKVESGKQALSALLAREDDPAPEAFQQIMLDTRKAPAHALPETGLPRDMENALSSRFIRLPHYGTRSTTLVRMDVQGVFHMDEWTYAPSGDLPASRASRRALSSRL